MHGDEAELAHRGVVAGARDEDGAEAGERGLARVPVAEGEQRVHGAAAAVLGERARVDRGGVLGVREHLRVAARADRMEERAIRLLGRVCEVAAEAVDEDGGASLGDGERVAPEPQREAQSEIAASNGFGRSRGR